MSIKKESSMGMDAVKLTTSKLITMGIALVSGMLLSRFRTLSEYGTYSQILMVINLATSLLMLGLPNSINYFLARAETETEKSKFLSVYYTLNTILSFIVGLALVLATPIFVKMFNNPLITNFIYFLAMFPWTKIITASIENILIVNKKTNLLMIFRIANSAFLLFIIVLVQFLGWTFNAYMVLYLIVELLFALAVYVIVGKTSLYFKIKFDKKLTKTIFAFSIPIGLASVIGTLNIELDKLMIGSLLNTEQLAIYTNASRELPFAIIATSITAVLLPRMARLLKKNENMKAISLWGDATVISFSIISFFSIACIVFAPEVMTVLYSEKYLAGINVFRIYNLALLLRCTYFGMILNSSGKTKFILYSSIGSLLLNVLLNYLFYYIFGFVGPAIATVISAVFMNLAQLIMTSKVVNIQFRKIFPWKQSLKILFTTLSMGIIIYFIKWLIVPESNIFLAIFLGSVWAIAYFILLFKPLKKLWIKINI